AGHGHARWGRRHPPHRDRAAAAGGRRLDGGLTVADRWTLKTPAGDVELNETFHAVTLTPGGVDAGGLLRRGRDRAYQRSGAGMRTPGPLRLRGLVWDDSRDVAAIRSALSELRDAVAACTEVVRVNGFAEYHYENLAGGPTPVVTPDGLGGYV